MTPKQMYRLAATAVAAAALIACASNPASNTAPAAAPAAAAPAAPVAKPAAKSADTKASNGIVGQPAAGSKFAKLKIGMDMSEIQNIMDRSPDRSHTYESGKRWIPFYFGSDARRMQALYKGEGCLIATGGNAWGGGGGELVEITVDPSGACYQP